MWNVAAVIPVDKGAGLSGNGNNGSSNSSNSGELVPEEKFLGIGSRELLARGGELLKRTRKGENAEPFSVAFTSLSSKMFHDIINVGFNRIGSIFWVRSYSACVVKL